MTARTAVRKAVPKAAAEPFEFTAVTVTFPKLNKDEKWGGVVSIGPKLHHVILLPGDNARADQATQLAWAKKQGGDLPSPLEQKLLLVNLKGEFKPEGYWSNQKLASDPRYAWMRYFDFGGQNSSFVDDHFRARAVRRVPCI